MISEGDSRYLQERPRATRYPEYKHSVDGRSRTELIRNNDFLAELFMKLSDLHSLNVEEAITETMHVMFASFPVYVDETARKRMCSTTESVVCFISKLLERKVEIMQIDVLKMEASNRKWLAGMETDCLIVSATVRRNDKKE